MKNANQFLNQILSRHELRSDYELANFLGITRSAVSRYRTKPEATFDDEVACKVAAALDLEPGYVLACMAAYRAKSAEVRKVWVETAKRFASMTAAVLLAFVAIPLLDYTVSSNAMASESMYIMSYCTALALWLALELLCVASVIDPCQGFPDRQRPRPAGILPLPTIKTGSLNHAEL